MSYAIWIAVQSKVSSESMPSQSLEIAEVVAVAAADVDPLAGGKERALIPVGDGFDFSEEKQVDGDVLVDFSENGRVQFGKEFYERSAFEKLSIGHVVAEVVFIRNAPKEWKSPFSVAGSAGCRDEVSLMAFMGPFRRILLPSTAQMPQARRFEALNSSRGIA